MSINTTTVGDPLTLTVEEAGRLLGVSRGAAYRAAACGQTPTIRVGRRLLVPTARLHRLLDRIRDRHDPAGDWPGFLAELWSRRHELTAPTPAQPLERPRRTLESRRPLDFGDWARRRLWQAPYASTQPGCMALLDGFSRRWRA